jgi:hypothetical protein
MYDPSEALLQLGLYDYVWGDPTLLQTYNSNVQADKSRREQMAYNNMWKNIELKKIAAEKKKEEAKAEAEQAKALEQEKKDKEVKLAKLYQDYNNATGEQERAYIRKQIAALNGTSPEVENEMLAAYDADRAAKEMDAKEEAFRHRLALKEIGKIEALSRKVKTSDVKAALAESVYDRQKYPNMNDEERDKLYANIKGISTIDEKIKGAVEGAVASHSGKKTGEALEEKDKAAAAKKKADDGYSLSTEEQELVDKYYGGK